MARVSKSERARRERMRSLNEVAGEIDGWEQGREVLTPVRSVQTVFPQFDVATRVNGYPIQRISLVHGPSNEGKTFFMLGMGKSFLAGEHYYFHVDAEFTTPEPWVVENLREFASYPTFRALRPRNYEHVAEQVRKACAHLVAAREQGRIPPETSALFGVDSLQKLIPADFLKRLAEGNKKEKGSVDPMAGRGGQIQAMFNAAWMKELVPMMYHANAGLMLISRESENVDAKGFFDQGYKVGGGKAPYYDSSLVCRVTRNGWVRKGSGDDALVIGERHLVQIVKTKVGHKDDKVTRCFFHTSNGQLIPAGFDMARDVLDLGLRTGTLSKDKGHNIIDGETGEVWGTINNAVQALTADPRALGDLRDRLLLVAEAEEEAA